MKGRFTCFDSLLAVCLRCLNGGQCLESGCLCRKGYSGERCQWGKLLQLNPINVNIHLRIREKLPIVPAIEMAQDDDNSEALFLIISGLSCPDYFQET